LDDPRLIPCLTPHGRLLLAASDDAPELEPALAERLRQAFARGAGHGLLRLGAAELGQVLPPVFAYWRGLGSRHVTAPCTRPMSRGGAWRSRRRPRKTSRCSPRRPDDPGAEYLTVEVLGAPWEAIGEAFTAEQAESGAAVQEFLKRLNPAWNVVGRVHFNLAENRKDEEALTFRLRVYRSLRLPRDLHEPALGGRPGPAPAPRPDARRVHGARGSLQLPEFKSSTSGSARSRRARAGALRGVTSNLRYTTRAEKERLVAPQDLPVRPQASRQHERQRFIGKEEGVWRCVGTAQADTIGGVTAFRAKTTK
jgi:hypothetical protein